MEQARYYRDRDNTFWIEIWRNGVIFTESEMDLITKFELRIQGTYYNSTTHPTAFVTDNPNGRVKIVPYNLGLDMMKELVEFLIYDSTNTHGIFWDTFELTVSGKVKVTTAPPTTLAPTTVP